MFLHKAKVIEPLEDSTSYLVSIGDGDREEILNYNKIMELVNNEMDKEQEELVWALEDIMDHRKIKHNKWEVFIYRTTREVI